MRGRGHLLSGGARVVGARDPRVERSARPRSIDVAVVGGGIGGLVAAACLARRGRQVALLEAGPALGGYLASFRRGGVVFDACVDSVGSVFEPDASPGLLGGVLAEAGVLDQVDWVELDPIRTQRFPAFEVVVPRGLAALEDHLQQLFPESRQGVREALAVLAGIHGRTRRVMGLACPVAPLQGFRDEPFGRFVERFSLSPEAAAALGSYSTFLGLNPSRVSTRALAELWMSYVQGGGWRVRGGFGRLADALARRFRDWGGKVQRNCPVSAVQRTAKGWQLTTGDAQLEAAAVVWAAPPPGPRSDWPVSSSFAILYARVRGDTAALPPSMGIYPGIDPEASLDPVRPWSGAFGVSVVPHGADKGDEASGALVLHLPLWASTLGQCSKGEIERKLEGVLRSAFPEAQVVDAEVATPSTLARYTRNPDGCAYGWEQSPRAVVGAPEAFPDGSGFQVAGHWAGLGGGVIPAAVAGWRAARRLTS